MMLLELIGYEEVLLDNSVTHGFSAMWKGSDGEYAIVEHPISGIEKDLPRLIQTFEHPKKAAQFWFSYTGEEASSMAREIAAYQDEAK